MNFAYLHDAAVDDLDPTKQYNIVIQNDGQDVLIACVFLICRFNISVKVAKNHCLMCYNTFSENAFSPSKNIKRGFDVK